MPRKLLLELLVVLVVLLAGTVMFRTTSLDVRLQQSFYGGPEAPHNGWFLSENQPWRCLYHAGNLPALLLAGAALIVLALGFRYRRFLPWRKITLFLVLVMLIGPGLIVNMVFKDHWGRPRPREIETFDGDSAFEPVWDTGVQGKGKSFPCGHCSMGFFLLAPWFVLRRRRPRAALAVLLLGVLGGGLIGIARMVQGGHFASDVLWSGGFVYLTALGLYYGLGLHRGIWYEGRAARLRSWAMWAAAPLLALLVFLVLLATPYYRDKRRVWREPLPERVRRFDITIPSGDLALHPADTLKVRWIARGFGLPNAAMRDELLAAGTVVRFSQWKEGLYTELDIDTELWLPPARFDTLRIEVTDGSLRVPSTWLETVGTALSPVVDTFSSFSIPLEGELHTERRLVIEWSAPAGGVKTVNEQQRR